MCDITKRRPPPAMRSIVTVFLAATACAVGLTGCAVLVAGSAAGVGTLAYIQGELKDQLPASPGETKAAIAEAVKSLELRQIKIDADNLSGDYDLKTGSDETVSIRYEKISDRATQISIRVGIFGDENLSRALLDEIKQNL